MKYLLLALSLVVHPHALAEREAYYSDQICEEEFKGELTTLPSGIRPDCETTFAVIEFDWAKNPKHYECIGQAYVYAYETGKKPVCVLLARTDDEERFAIRMKPIFQFAGVKLLIRRTHE